MGSQTSREEPTQAIEDKNKAQEVEDDDEPDEWEKRIYSTGCADAVGGAMWLMKADENARMTDCYFEKKDWRACAKEMEDFKACWKSHGNEQRTSSKDA